MEYYKIYMQKEAENSPVMETIADFRMYCMDIPFTMGGKSKALTERSWAGEDGKDVYVPKTLPMESYAMKVKFGFKGDKFSANNILKKLLDYLCGKDGNGVYLKMYCDYTQIGRQHVRFDSISDDANLIRNGSDGDILIVTVTFIVDDPTTDINATKNLDGSIISLD